MTITSTVPYRGVGMHGKEGERLFRFTVLQLLHWRDERVKAVMLMAGHQSVVW